MTDPQIVYIGTDALKMMMRWSLLCMGVLKTKDEDFAIDIRKDGVVVRTLP